MILSTDTQPEFGYPKPRNIRLYLKMNGWQSPDPPENGPSIWQLPTPRGTFEVIAPSSENVTDFPERVTELARTVSVAENRSPDEVLRDLATLGFDIQYIRHEYASPRGTAPLRDAAEAYSAVYSMIAAVAASLEEPRPVLPYRKPAQATNFVKRVLAGPTHSGSYVISVWTPVPPRLTPEEDAVLFEMEDEPYERRATAHLHTALSATRAAVRDVRLGEAGVGSFIERVRQGVSANLCESLVALAGEDETPFNVKFSWATDRPMPVEEPTTVQFDADNVPILSEAARTIRANLPEEDVRIRGNVIRLHRESQLRGGEVTVAGIISGDPTEKMRRVTLSLDRDDYQAAVNAHHDYADVEVVGSLTQRGNRTHLTQAREFFVQPEPGLE